MSEVASITLADGRVIGRGQTLRSLPGRREVFEGRLDGRRVVVKVFLDPRRARVHFQREVDGLAAFSTAGIAAPRVLYSGSDIEANPVIVLAWIGDAIALSSCWKKADQGQRVQLMQRMMALLASHHSAGIYQTDLHLDNFLVSDDLIYSLDGDAVVAQKDALDEARSLRNLALFFSQLHPDQDAQSLQSSTHYARLRGWSGPRVVRRLPGLIGVARAYRWRKLRGKIYRNCTAVVHSRDSGQESFVLRAWAAALEGLLSDLDASCPSEPAHRLKDGNTATVWRTDIGTHRVVVKRYNVKDRLHAIRRTLRESRASISWRNAHMLGMFGIKTPAPLACVMRRDGPLRRVAYFIAEDVGGTGLPDWIDRHQGDPVRVRQLAAQLGQLFAQMQRAKISHGDMKASNFIVAEQGVFVIDLDSMRQHRSGDAFDRAWRRDVARFAVNWRDRPKVRDILLEEIRSAG